MNEFNEDEKKYQIALSLIQGVGDVIGKKLLAFTGSAKGCDYLIKSQQAILLESASDIVKGLNWDVNDLAVQQSMFVDLTDDEKK